MSKKIKEILEIEHDEFLQKAPVVELKLVPNDDGEFIIKTIIKTKPSVKSMNFFIKEQDDDNHKLREAFQDFYNILNKNKMKRIEKIKEFVKDNFKNYNGGLFFTENVLGDRVELLEEIDDVGIYGCDQYSYLEIYDLDDEEENELLEYYNELWDAKYK